MRRKIVGVLLGAGMVIAMAGPASAATTPNQQFVFHFMVNPDGSTSSCQVVATGPVSGTGTCTINNVTDTVTRVKVMLPGGTVTVRAKTVSSNDQFFEGQCAFISRFNDMWTIVGGTGAYANATGSGTDTGTFVGNLGRNGQGGCNENPVTQVGVVIATGHVTLGGSSSAAA